MPTVAVLGAGRMGAAMAARLIGGGYDVVLFNRTRARAEQVAGDIGARVADSAGAAAAEADVVMVSLADDPAVREVYGGQHGLTGGLRSGTVVLEMSTIAPRTVRDLAAQVGGAGAALLDAPVSGSVPVVEQGELTVLVGGEEAALGQARPALSTFSRRIFHLGPLGAGATVKLAVNSIVHALNQAVAEALVLAEKAGVDRAAAYEVFANSAAGAPFVQYKKEAFLHPEAAPVAFALDLVAKDLALIESLAGEVGARMDLTAAGRGLVEQARQAGLGQADLSALAELLRR